MKGKGWEESIYSGKSILSTYLQSISTRTHTVSSRDSHKYLLDKQLTVSLYICANDVCCAVIMLASGGESALQMTSALVNRYHLLTSTLQLLLKRIGNSINHISGGCFSHRWLF